MSSSSTSRSSTILLMSQLFLLFFISSVFPATAASIRPGFLYARPRRICTPQFWSSKGEEEWPRMVPQKSTVSKVFGSRAIERYRFDLTLLEATARNDDVQDPFAALLKQASAALINSYARKGFPYSAWEVKNLVIQSLVSKDAAARQAAKFSLANEACY